LAGGGFFEEIWILENQLLFIPPRKAGAQTAKWAFIERMLVSGRFAQMVEERFIKDAKYLGGEPGEVKQSPASHAILFRRPPSRGAKCLPTFGSWAALRSMKLFAAICLALAMASPLLWAEDPISPKGWEPSTNAATQYLKDVVQDQTGQQVINRLTGYTADLLDAQLFVAYIKLYERLDEKGKATLKEEQTQWLKKREKVSTDAAQVDQGGSLSPMEGSVAFADFTTKRLHALEARLKKLPSQPKAR
jgi:uncharacterized protein YecT (DUF1311 family)